MAPRQASGDRSSDGAVGPGTALDPEAVRDWLFDLDNTVYPAACNLFVQIDARINAFIQSFLGLEPAAARAVQSRFFHAHGSSLAGLMIHHGLQPGEFLDYVHDIDLSVLSPAPALGTALAALPGRKLIYTNGSTRHAENVLSRLGIADHFTEIFDIAAAEFLPKPRAEPLAALIARHDIEPRASVFIEDLARNLEPAAALGITTVWVAERTPSEPPEPFIHHVTEDLPGWLQGLTRAGS